jgi:geranylgeranyl reductase family protein
VRGERSDPSGPGPDGCIPTAVRVQNRERVGGSRIALDGDENATFGSQGLKNAPVVRLETHASHRAGESQFAKVACTALQGVDERPLGDNGSHDWKIEPIPRRAEYALHEGRHVGGIFRDDGQCRRRKACTPEGLDSLLRPRDILKHTNREERCVDCLHTQVMYHGVPSPLGRVDVAVVGAGPSGAWAARGLARSGARVALIDASHPREKPCGGGVTGRALARVAAALDLATLPAVVIREARFIDPHGGAPATVTLDGRDAAPPLVVVSREQFDAELVRAAERAGATLVHARAIDVTAGPQGVRVVTNRGSLRADFVIGADGATSLVRRRLARPLARDQLSIATGYFVRDRSSETIVLEFTADPAGYIWSFPRPTHLAVGMCAQADAGIGSSELRIRVARWIAATGLGDSAALQPYAWPIPSMSEAGLARSESSGRGWCLVGDAAGFVDPITREGIFFAIESAELAVEALTSRGPAHTEYAQAVADTILPELTRAARVKARFFRPRFSALLLAALRDSASVRRVMADLVAGRQPYKGLAWRLAATLELRLAAKALHELRH